MHGVHAKLQNPLTAARDAADRARLQTVFPELSACPEPRYLALRPYVESRPERLFNQAVYTVMLAWLKQRDELQRGRLRCLLASADAEINRAMVFLRQINSEDWHDRALTTGDEYDRVRSVDRQLHPAYLRLAEGVLAPLTRPVAYFSRLDRQKNPEGLDVYNVVQELSNTAMAQCVQPYCHTMRNAIAHGGITYMKNSIRYRDKKGNEDTLSVRTVIRLCDDMVDTCNGLAAALKVFLILFRDSGYGLPRELLLEELVEETRSPWWGIEGCVEAEFARGSQLLVYARPNSRHRAKVQWSALQSAVIAEALAPGYEQYFFSLRTPKAWPGWAAFNGKELQRLRESGAINIQDYAPALEETGLFYLPRPALPSFLGRIDTLLHSFRLQWGVAKRHIQEQLGNPDIVCRNARIHRSGWVTGLKGDIVIESLTHETAADTIRGRKRQIVCQVARQARFSKSWLDSARYFPLGYARVAVFSKDFRRRRLSSFGLGPELVCTMELRRIRGIKAPDIVGSTVELVGNWRIAWNRAWMESGGRIGTESEDA